MARNQPVKIRIAGDAALLNKTLKGVSKRMGGLAKVGKTAGLGMAAGIGVGVAAIVKLGSTMESVERTIRVGTGATGDALDGLMDITKNLAGKVPSDFESIATAVADINTRLGLTGDDLEDFSEQMLNLSRITGTDLQGNIQGVSRVLGDWGDQAGTAAGAADYLFSIAQSTGIEFSQLSRNLVAYGAPLRQIGFDFETSAALIGKFEKEGVNAELVLGSLRQALGKMAREGEPAIETFRRTTDAIKNAGTASEANKLALELFGARAGPDMAAAIREGRFELDDYFEIMDGGGDRINTAAKETETLGEKLTILKNRVILALTPVVEKAFAAITRAFEALAPHVELLVARFREFLQSEQFQRFQRQVSQALNKLAQVFERVKAKVKEFVRENPEAVFAALAVVIGTVLVGAIAAVVAAFATLLSPAVLVVAGIAAVAAGVTYAWKEFEVFRDIVHGVADFFQDNVVPIFKAAIGGIVEAFESLWDTIEEVVGFIQAIFRGDMEDAWNHLKGAAGAAIGFIVDLFIGLPMDIINAAKPLMGKFALIVADFTTGLFFKIRDLVQQIPGKIVEFITAVGADLVRLGGTIASWIGNGILAGISTLKDAVLGALEDLIPDWIPDWLNPFSGNKEKQSLSGGKRKMIPDSNSPDWSSYIAGLGIPKGAQYQFDPLTGRSELVDAGDQLGLGAPTISASRLAALGASPATVLQTSPTEVVINVQGSVVTEGELVENVRLGLLKSQRSGRELVLD